MCVCHMQDFEEFCTWYFGDGAFRKKAEEEQV